MGLFTRKKPPVYCFDENWQPVTDITTGLAAGEKWTWTCPSDYYFQLIAQTYSYTKVPFLANTLLWWSLDEAQYRLFTWGFRTWFTNGTLVQSHSVIAQRSLDTAVNDRSFDALPDHLYITPGQRLNFNAAPFGAMDKLNYVALTLKRWSFV